jgi:hypothetical protein
MALQIDLGDVDPIDVIADLIHTLETDEQIRTVADELRHAQKRIWDDRARDATRDLAAGDRVRITAGISPKYLVGLEAVVTKRPAYGAKYVACRWDDPRIAWRGNGKRGNQQPTNLPASCVEKIEG